MREEQESYKRLEDVSPSKGSHEYVLSDNW